MFKRRTVTHESILKVLSNIQNVVFTIKFCIIFVVMLIFVKFS